MADEMLLHLGGKQPDRAKASRWIGFIQGILWMTRTFTIDELRQHTKDAGKPQRPPNHDTPTA